MTARTSLFKAVKQCGLPLASSCDEEFICGKCNLEVLSGALSLTRQTTKERKLLAREGKPTTDRISCRAYVTGDVTVTASYW